MTGDGEVRKMPNAIVPQRRTATERVTDIITIAFALGLVAIWIMLVIALGRWLLG